MSLSSVFAVPACSKPLNRFTFSTTLSTLCCALAAAGPVNASDEIVVTATRLPTPAERIGSSVTVISAEDIERNKYRSVADALIGVPSLSIIRSGGIGKLTNIFSRGSESNHTLVLLDGIELNDPSSTDGLIDLSHIYIKDVERIEVVLGPQSTLYGSDAIGAVVQIFTRQPTDEPSWDFEAEFGNFHTWNQYAATRGKAGKWSYAVGLQHTDTDGVSALSNEFRQANGVLDNDRHENTTLDTRLGYAASDLLRFDLFTRYIKSENDLDLNSTNTADDSDSAGDAEQWLVGFNTYLTPASGFSEHRFGIAYTAIDRDDWDDPDVSNPSDRSREKNRGWKRKFDLQNDFYAIDNHVITLGMETEEDVVRSSINSMSFWGPFTSTTAADARNDAVYLQDQIQVGKQLSLTLGLRRDKHEDFGAENTYRAAFAYRIPQSATRLRGNYGTGFKAPTVNQLYTSSVTSFGPFNGNPDLRPETSKGWELGADQSLAGDTIQLGATYYENEIEDLIVFTNDFSSLQNLSRVDTSGIEAYLNWKMHARLSSRLNYAHTRAEDSMTREELRRRPLNKATLQLSYQITDKLHLQPEIIYTDRRYDTDAVNFNRILRPSYTLANLAARYQIDSEWQFFARIENLFDRDYEEPHGFEQPGIGIYTGVRLSL